MIDELANRADWNEALRQGYKGSYAEWQHDRPDWFDYRKEVVTNKTDIDNFYVWKEKKKKARDLDLSYAAAKQMGFTGTRDQWAKFINTMRGPSAYEIWMANNSEDIQDVFGKECITEKEWSDMLFSTEYISGIFSKKIKEAIHAVTEDEIDQVIDEVIAEKQKEG